jgi:hypothetical protein
VLLVFVVGGCATKEFYYVKDLPPTLSASLIAGSVPQYAAGTPPLLRPHGKRRSIAVTSQKFTLAVPDCIDATGRAEDLKTPLADMLYTALFATERFSLYDRSRLVNLDPEWLKKWASRGGSDGMSPGASAEPQTSVDELIDYFDTYKTSQIENLDAIEKNVDGLLFVYITAIERHDEAGTIDVDYRIVSPDESQTVLFARDRQITFEASNQDEVRFNRADVGAIANQIFEVFPNPVKFRDAQIIAVDGDLVTVDEGANRMLVPGMRGYVVSYEDTGYTRHGEKAQDREYLAQFQILHVYERTSRARILPAQDRFGSRMKSFDVRVGDAIILK